METYIVLDCTFGDSGKGVVVDNLCDMLIQDSKKPLVVRFSGGQQCGHTVMTEDVKHTFSNFGSGSLLGVSTYFSEHTTMNPSNLLLELDVLKEKGVNPKVYFHPHTMVTTPYDIIYNIYKEFVSKNGSCGMGVGATMKRNIESPYKLRFIDITNPHVFSEKLKQIEQYYRNLFIECDFGFSNSELLFTNELIKYENYIENYMKDVMMVSRGMDSVVMSDLHKINGVCEEFDVVVFEGSQGIMLDMEVGIFPNVTYAKTTSKNAMEIIQKNEYDAPYMYYVTRCYETRHGDGWMPNEEVGVDLYNNEEEINVFNDHQGDFRVSKKDTKLIKYAIENDIADHPTRLRPQYNSLVVTCVDQLENGHAEAKRIFDRIDHFDFIHTNHSPMRGSLEEHL